MKSPLPRFLLSVVSCIAAPAALAEGAPDAVSAELTRIYKEACDWSLSRPDLESASKWAASNNLDDVTDHLSVLSPS